MVECRRLHHAWLVEALTGCSILIATSDDDDDDADDDDDDDDCA